MGRISVVIAALVLLIGGSAAAQSPMQAFSPPGGRFSIMMPGTPQSSRNPIKQTNGDTTTAYKFWVEVDGGAGVYMVMYNDDPTPQSSPQGRLMASRDGVVKSAKATLLSDRITNLNGVPGRIYSMRGTEDGYNWDVASYYQDRRLYQILALSPPGKTAEYRDAYMNSFRILP